MQSLAWGSFRMMKTLNAIASRDSAARLRRKVGPENERFNRVFILGGRAAHGVQ